jgi:hypothetical protein
MTSMLPIPILILGVLILVLGGRLLVDYAKRSRNPAVTIDDFSKARLALNLVSVETMTIKRIFATEDADFIASSGLPDVESFFRKERRTLALAWLRATQKRVANLMDMHLRLAAYTYEPSPAFEIRLSANYLFFVLVSKFLFLLLWLSGPFAVARAVGYTTGMTAYFCSTFGVRLDSINPMRLVSTPDAKTG